MAWKWTDRLVKGWIIGTISEEILSHIAGQDTTASAWNALKSNFAKKSMDIKLTLQHQHETLIKDQCDSLDDYLRKFKTQCHELAAIGKSSLEDRMKFWLLNGLGAHFQTFTTMMVRPPIPEFSELLSMLHSYETRVFYYRIQVMHLPSKTLEFL